ncbi:MAG: aminopeptidase [Candidatus Sumerlaeia bacterium]|nr:aminopeptidase [Candidatus Sumerlaeia bacterium]
MDIRIERLADLLVRYSNKVRRGDVVEIHGPPAAAPLIEAVYRKALEAGALVRAELSLPSLVEILLRHGNEAQLKYWRPTLLQDIRDTQCFFEIWAEENTRAHSNIDPARDQIRQRARRPLRDLFMQRAAEKKLRWVGTIYPTHGMAQDAEMSLAEYTDFFLRACKCDRPDPVAAWKDVERRQRRIVRRLTGTTTLRVVARDTDLTLSVAGRKWENCCGTENMPDGEVFTSPVENSAEGTIRFSFPAIHDGREVQDIRLTFRRGRVVEATAAKNEDYLRKMIALDEGSQRLGEFAFGLNDDIQQFTRDILFDEKIGGTVHIALGAAFPETGGKNKSALHWDMICDLRKAGEVFVDGKRVFTNGKWLF